MAPPLIGECRAHLECTLKSVTRLGAEVVVFGTIVAASIDEDCAASCLADQYFRLRPVFFLEEGAYGSIDTAKRIGAAWPAEQSLTVVELYDPPGDQDVGSARGLPALAPGLGSPADGGTIRRLA